MDDPFSQTPDENRALAISVGVLALVVIGIVVALLLGANISNSPQPAAVAAAPTVTAATALSPSAAVATAAAPAATTKAPAAAATTAPAAGGGGAAGNPQAGLTAFRKAGCPTCHLNNGLNAGGVGPQLSVSNNANNPDYIRTIVRNGKGAMQAFDADTVSDTDLNNIVAYLLSIHKK